MSIENLSAVEIGRQIAAGKVSSVEVVKHFLNRIETFDNSVGAYVHVDGDRAIDRATSVDRDIKAGKVRAPLAGVPVAIKDVLCTSGVPTTCGSRMLENFVPPYTATCVSKLENASLVVLGKTNMDEFAMGGSTETSCHGLTRNPWDPERTAGGSSGGAAACLAAGMAPLSIGTDTGGSVRQPAAMCGVLGLKPTYGRVSRYGLVAFASSLDQVGALGHSVEDLAAVMEILAGHDPKDTTSLKTDVPAYRGLLEQDLKGVKVGLLRDQIDHSSLDPEIAAAVDRTRQQLEALGATISEVELPYTKYAVPTYYLVAPSEASGNLSRYDGVHYGYRADTSHSSDQTAPLDAMISASRSEGFGPEVKRRIMLGTFALSSGYYDAYYKKALKVRRLIAGDYQRAFEEADVLLGPMTPSPAFRLGEKVNDPVKMYLEDAFSVGANLAGLPGLSVPAGLTESGLPIGVQLQAPVLQEQRLLNVARSLEQAEFFKPALAPKYC
ncbi:MAG TPA: Asp-tRNA(Asn)/Glu-tRNA(Gln) amidotransferase GatCAB subunit A [Planctomycetaceae bacterium]|nr:Asp-tRNA(Asn)/Glu-tRNA(Gln) amidotransferase GatCAB subunit A [Planctomycetaceae bacterium]